MIKKQSYLPTLFFLILSNLLAYLFVSYEHTLYEWDRGNYWHMSTEILDIFRAHPRDALALIYSSIQGSDYNYLPALLPALAMEFFGKSRFVFILSVVNFYLFPAYLVLISFIKEVKIGPGTDSGKIEWVTTGTFLFFTPLWMAILMGYPGVGGLFIVFLCYKIYFQKRPASTLQLVSVGLLLTLIFIFRKWYAFWVESFLITIFVDATYLYFISPKTISEFRRIFRVPFVIAFSAASSVFILAYRFLIYSWSRNFPDINTPYKHNFYIVDHFRTFIRFYGGNFTLIFFAILIFCLAKRRYTRLITLLLFQALMSVSLILKIQDLSIHQYYLFTASVLPIAILGVTELMESLGALKRIETLSFVAAGILFGLLTGYFVYIHPLPGGNFPASYHPDRRSDLSEIKKITVYLNQEIGKKEKSKVCIFNDSVEINSSLFVMAELSLGVRPLFLDRILQAPILDKRDGFPTCVLDSDLLLIPEPRPPQQFSPNDQRVEIITIHSIKNGLNIGEAFRLEPVHFELEHGIGVLVYKRIRPNTQAQIDQISAILRPLYPDRPFIYQGPRIK